MGVSDGAADFAHDPGGVFRMQSRGTVPGGDQLPVHARREVCGVVVGDRPEGRDNIPASRGAQGGGGGDGLVGDGRSPVVGRAGGKERETGSWQAAFRQAADGQAAVGQFDAAVNGGVLVRDAMSGKVEPAVRRHAGKDGLYRRVGACQVRRSGEGMYQVFRLFVRTRQRLLPWGVGHGHDQGGEATSSVAGPPGLIVARARSLAMYTDSARSMTACGPGSSWRPAA